MKLSFAVPVYNVEPYIERCVRSLFGQTLDEVEYVFVDDCSPDRSIELLLTVLEEYPERKPFVKIIRHEKNQGIALSRKDAYLNTTGDYVISVDSDDDTEPQMAELLYNKAVETNADMVVCNGYWHRREGLRILESAPYGEGENGSFIRDAILNRKVTPGVWVKLVKRDLIFREDMIWPRGDHGEDVVFSSQFTYNAKKIAYVDAQLYHYRYNGNSICNLPDPKQRERNAKDEIKNIEDLERFLKSHGVEDKYWYGVFVNKFYAKMLFLPYVGQRKYRRLWFKTYPELNRVLFWGDERYKSSYKQKIWMAAIWLGIYPKFKRRLATQRFCPNNRWRVW